MHLDLLSIPQSHSAHWLPTRKKLLYTVANPARGLLNRGIKKEEKSLAAPPPPRALIVRRKEKRKEKSRDASTSLGATQVGVMQVNAIGTQLCDPKLGTDPMAYGGFINGRRRGTREESRK